MIKIFSNGRFKINRKFIIQETERFASDSGVVATNQINVVFVGRRKMIEIARKYKKESVALPVLSFAYDANSVIPDEDPEFIQIDSRFRGNDKLDQTEPLGEIFICYPQAVLLAAERERAVDKMMVELICHGIENIIA